MTNNKIPSPQGVFLVVIWRTLVGILTGPFTLRCLSLAPRTKSAQTNIKWKTKHECCSKRNINTKETLTERTLFEIFDMLRGKGDPNLMDLLLGFFQTRLGGFHCSVRHFGCSLSEYVLGRRSWWIKGDTKPRKEEF